MLGIAGSVSRSPVATSTERAATRRRRPGASALERRDEAHAVGRHPSERRRADDACGRAPRPCGYASSSARARLAQLVRRDAVAGQEAVRVERRGVARPIRVHDEHRRARAAEVQRRRQSGGAAADDDASPRLTRARRQSCASPCGGSAAMTGGPSRIRRSSRRRRASRCRRRTRRWPCSSPATRRAGRPRSRSPRRGTPARTPRSRRTRRGGCTATGRPRRCSRPGTRRCTRDPSRRRTAVR